MVLVQPTNLNFVKIPTKQELRQLFLVHNSWTAYYLLEIIHKEFLVKSRGRADSLGTKWKPLSENRRIYKPTQPGEVSKSLLKKISGGRLTKKQAFASRKPPINIDTHRLIDSLAPGSVTGTTYIPHSKDQKVKVTPTSIEVDILVPYSDEVQSVRPYFPVNLDPWLNKAKQKAYPHFQKEAKLMGLTK